MTELENWLGLLPEMVRKTVQALTAQNARLLFVDDVPKGKGRPRFTRTGRCYTPKSTSQAEDRVRWAGSQLRENVITGPMGVLVVAVFPIPTSWSKKKRQEAEAGQLHPAVKPDFDNVAKLYCDALNGLMWEDDKQIVDGRCIKVYGQQPGVLVAGWAI